MSVLSAFDVKLLFCDMFFVCPQDFMVVGWKLSSGQVFYERSLNSGNGLDTSSNGWNCIVWIIAEELLIRMRSYVAQKIPNSSKLMATFEFLNGWVFFPVLKSFFPRCQQKCLYFPEVKIHMKSIFSRDWVRKVK